MEHNNLFEKIKQTADNGVVTPSNDVWNRLEKRLDKESEVIESPRPTISLYSKLAFAASVLLIVGAYGYLNSLADTSDTTTAIKLENLHTLEINPHYNIQMAGESATIPAVRLLRATPALYKSTIKEGSAEQKLILRKDNSNDQKEFGLG